jgi:DNA segregation ATPase FtsK/SpoIIIE, S-DNA-T family
MTYSLNTLNADRAQQAPGGVARFAQEIGLVLGAAGLAFWLLALVSHSLADPAWSTTGTAAEAGNWAGRLGALLADWSYFLLGFRCGGCCWPACGPGCRRWLDGSGDSRG